MDLRKKYVLKSTAELVAVLEMPDNYTPEALTAAKEAIEDRIKHEADEINQIALEFNTNKVWEQLNSLNPLNDELVFFKSHFLDEVTIKKIYKEQFEKLLKEKEGFRFDVWQYAIGGL